MSQGGMIGVRSWNMTLMRIDVLWFNEGRVIFKQILHLAGNCRGFDGFRRFSAGQLQCERARMQRQAVKPMIPSKVVCGPRRAVACVTDYRMAGQFRMAPDLMRAAGKKLDFHHRVMGAVVKDPVTGLGCLAGVRRLRDCGVRRRSWQVPSAMFPTGRFLPGFPAGHAK